MSFFGMKVPTNSTKPVDPVDTTCRPGMDKCLAPFQGGTPDVDNDGYPGLSVSGIKCPDAGSLQCPINVDCADDDPDRSPGLPEVPDGKDNDCNNIIDDN